MIKRYISRYFNVSKWYLLFILVSPAVITGCNGGEREHHDEHGHAGHHDDGEEHDDDHDHEGLILLSHEQLETLGVKSEEIRPTDFYEVIKVSGEITAAPGSEGAVAARQGGIVTIASGIAPGISVTAGRTVATVNAAGMTGGDPNEAARVAYDAAKRELDRITPLHKEGIVSTRDYNAALQRVEETSAMMGASGSRRGSAATAPVSGVITSLDVVDGQYVEPGQTIATISSNNALTLRADLPETAASRISSISGARFRPSYSTEVTDVTEAGGKLLSPPTATSSKGGYIPVFFTLPKGDSRLINGTFCEVYLLSGARENVIAVDEKAVSEQQGKYFVYIEKSPGHYEKRNVTIGQTDGTRREILAGVTAGETVVTDGMTFVRLAETSGVVPEGHSHSH